ncbi:hypothetical protein BC829DRAFT_417761 [Chytridium lagenaria]|nr:hypothetical protein BC829DRAFT_417761 [Chytridium lagenaria]
MDNLLDAPKGFSDMLSKTFRKIKAVPSFVPWLLQHNEKMTMPFINQVLEEIKTIASFVGVVGYCFGGRYSTLCGSDPRVHAIASVHPSALTLPSDIKGLNTRSYFAFAEKDTVVPLSQATHLKAVAEQVKVFKGMNHGFAIRGNEELEEVMVARNECLQDIIDFFNKQ